MILGSSTIGKQESTALPLASVVPPVSQNADSTQDCAVLFLDAVRYSEQPFAEQVEIKQRINAAVLEATRHLSQNDRILLDTGDGVAISFQTQPEDALFVALHLWRALAAPDNGAPVAIRTGINYGKVSVLRDINGQPNVIGDGINMAQRVMSFADPGQLLISRTFYNVLVERSDTYATMFKYCGLRTDKHVREHELYELTTPLEELQQTNLSDVLLPHKAKRLHKWNLTSGARRAILLTAAVALSVVLGMVTTNWMSRESAQPLLPRAAAIATAPVPVAAEPEPAAIVQSSKSVPVQRTATTNATPSAGQSAPGPSLRELATLEDEPRSFAQPAPVARQRPPAALVKPSKLVPMQRTATTAQATTKATPTAAQPAPAPVLSELAMLDSKPQSPLPPAPTATAALAFVVSPWAEVVVDGRSYGATPPLSRLPLSPGEHLVELRNGVSDPYRTVVRVQPDQVVRIQHKFEPTRKSR